MKLPINDPRIVVLTALIIGACVLAVLLFLQPGRNTADRSPCACRLDDDQGGARERLGGVA